MRRAALKRGLSQPATRLTAVAVLVAALVVAQFALLLAGGVAADREAANALGTSFQYLTDLSQERVLLSANAVDQLVVGTSALLSATPPASQSELVAALAAALENTREADSLIVAYPSGDYLQLRRSTLHPGGFQGFWAGHDDQDAPTRTVVEYDPNLDVVSSTPAPTLWGVTAARFYRAAATSDEPVWTGPTQDPATGLQAERLSLATRDSSGEVKIVVAADLSIAQLHESLASVPSGSDGRVSLLTGDRVVIMTPGDSGAAGAAPHFGTGANAADVGVETNHPATVAEDDVVGTNGRYTVLERGLASQGLDWVVHVRVSASGLNEGFGRLKTTLNVVIGGLAVLTFALGYVLAMMWRPVTALREGAERDSLTGLYNRRRGEAAAQSLVKYADRTGARAVAAMLDVDHFKELNDEFGHSAGDRALTQIGERLAAETRGVDVAIRWGGDEFLLVLLLAPADEAQVVVERFRTQAADALKEVFPSLAELGVTAGFSVSDASGIDIDALIVAADRALVHGKSLSKGESYSHAATPAG